MKFALHILIWFFLVLLASCSGGLYDVDRPYVQQIDDLKEFDIDDFSIYVFNICEKFDSKTNFTERFCDCPDNFYELKETDSIKKIEEVYFMLNRPAKLAIYVTTRSHKYISNKRRGFLNDSAGYRNKINLNQIEYIYVGHLDEIQNRLYFPDPRGDENDHIILQYKAEDLDDRLLLEQAHIATAENKYNTRVPIPLADVFNAELNFKKKEYQPVFFMKDTARVVEKVIFTENQGLLNMLVTFKNLDQIIYRVGNQRLRYQLPYAQIDTLNAEVRDAYRK